jgi:ribose transport system substrate-binding protein
MSRTMNRHRMFGLLAVAALAATLPACSSQPPSSGKLKVAFITNNEYEFWKFAQRGCEAAAKDLDVDVEFKMPSGGGSAEQQRRFIEDLLSKGIKAISISPYDAANQTSFFQDVNGRVPLLMVDSDAADPSARRCYLGTNNVRAGEAAGDLVKKAAPDGGKFVIFVGRLDVQNAVERRQGVMTSLAGGADRCTEQIAKVKKGEYPIRLGKYELLSTKTDTGKQEICRTQVDDTLSQVGDLQCMVGLWAYNPPAMLEGVKAAKKVGKVALVGFDENEETLQGIKDGSITGTVVQNPYEFGYQSVKIMAGLAKGDQTALSRPDLEADNCIYIPHRTITKDNVEAFHEEVKKLLGK